MKLWAKTGALFVLNCGLACVRVALGAAVLAGLFLVLGAAVLAVPFRGR